MKYTAFNGPCTPTTRFISISAELLGPVIKLIQDATVSPFSTRLFISSTACVIRGTSVSRGIIARYTVGKSVKNGLGLYDFVQRSYQIRLKYNH